MFIKTVFFFASFLPLVTMTGVVQEDVRDRYIAQTYTNSASDTLLYRLLIPKNYDKNQQYPLVLFLHGAGERGNDNVAQLRHGAALYATDEAMEKYPCFVLAPQCPAKKSWANIKFSKEAEEIQLRSK